jgi:ABC-2 type transport system ATP-binding protein
MKGRTFETGRLLCFSTLFGAVLCAACGSGGSVAGGSASGPGSAPVPGTHHYLTSTALVDVIDGPDDAHHATIDTRLYIPDNATAATPQPAIVMTHGFGLSKDSAEVTSMADFLARHGYVVLAYTGQGFGQSSGCIRLDSADYDVKDSMQLTDKLLVPRPEVARDAKGPLVGLIGGSYGGGITLNVAALDPRVRALVPGRTWNSLQFALDPNNLVTANDPTGFSHQLAAQGVFKSEWTSLFFADGNAGAAQGNGGCAQEKAASGDPTTVAGVACLGYPTEVCQTYATLSATGNADAASLALVKNSSVESFIGQLRAPTMLVQGQSDTLFNENDAAGTYTALKAAGVPVAMIWNSGGHGGYDSLPGECEVYGNGTTGLDACYLPLRALAWFDRWLRGDSSVDTGPAFAWYSDWLNYDNSGSAYGQYGRAAAFPAQGTVTYLLSGSADLVAPGTSPTAGSAQLINPPGGTPASYSETSNFTGPQSSPSLASVPPSDPPGEAVSFTSKPFARDTVSVGVPSAHLHIANINTQDLVFFGKVFDVAPDGSTTLIHRLIAPVRVPATDAGKPVDIHLLGFAHQFAKGHSVRLTIASTDQTSYNSKVPDQITITTGGSDPSSFTLPVDDTSVP